MLSAAVFALLLVIGIAAAIVATAFAVGILADAVWRHLKPF